MWRETSTKKRAGAPPNGFRGEKNHRRRPACVPASSVKVTGCVIHLVVPPVGETVLVLEMLVGEEPRLAAVALARVRAICVRVVFVADVPEPMDVVFVGKESHAKGVHWGIAPSLVVESACLVQMLGPLCVWLASIKVHVCDFEVGPEVAGGVAAGELCLHWVLHVFHEEVDGGILIEVVFVLVEELERFWPQGGHCFLCVVQADDEAVDLVVHLHEFEDVIVDVAKIVCVGFKSPVVLKLPHSRVVEEVDAVVPAHVVVGDFVCVRDVLLLEDLHLALLLGRVDPVWLVPVLGLDFLEVDLGGGHFGDSVDEVFLEFAVVEDHIRVVELGVELFLDLPHCVEDAPEVLVFGHDHQRGVGQLVCGRVDGPDELVDLGLRDDLLENGHQLVVVVFDDLFTRGVLVMLKVEAFQSVARCRPFWRVWC